MSILEPVLTGLSAALLLRWGIRQRRKARIEERIHEANRDGPLAVEHLSPGLAHVAVQTRIARLALETPLKRFVHPVIDAAPWSWSRREKCDEFDEALITARRALWDWMWEVAGLGQRDRAVLTALGLSIAPIREVVHKRGVLDRTDDLFEQVPYPRLPDIDRVGGDLWRAVLALKSFEYALLRWRAGPYRSAA